MTEGAQWKAVSSRAAVISIDVPSQSTPSPDGGGRLNRGHLLDTGPGEDSNSIEGPSIQHHSAKPRQIGSRGENSRVTRCTPKLPRGWIVDFPAQNFSGNFLG